jgi:serine/threonine protein kinase
MKKLEHPNVIKMEEVIEEKETNELYLIMEYVTNGTLAQQIDKGELSEGKIKAYF